MTAADLAATSPLTLGAGGTGSRPRDIQHPSPARQWRLAFEIALFFVAAPLAIRSAVYDLRIPLFLILPPLMGGFILYLLWDRTFHVRRELAKGFTARDLASILAVFLIVGGSVAAFVAQEMPRQFLSFPRQRPELWLLIILLYPLLSVAAQELLYRTFFFHRYGPLFGDLRRLMIITNGVLFGFAHILFNNWIAVAGTLFTGLLFAYRYETTRSFWAVFVEHTLWGWLAFTVGLGGYFFTGVANRW